MVKYILVCNRFVVLLYVRNGAHTKNKNMTTLVTILTAVFWVNVVLFYGLFAYTLIKPLFTKSIN